MDAVENAQTTLLKLSSCPLLQQEGELLMVLETEGRRTCGCVLAPQQTGVKGCRELTQDLLQDYDLPEARNWPTIQDCPIWELKLPAPLSAGRKLGQKAKSSSSHRVSSWLLLPPAPHFPSLEKNVQGLSAQPWGCPSSCWCLAGARGAASCHI